MKILVDENIPWMTVQALLTLGHDVLDIRGTSEEGMDDEPLWTVAQRDGRLLITTDKGFTRHRHEPHYGVLVVRLRQPNLRKIHDRILEAITKFEPDEWPGMIVVIRDMVQSVWRRSDTG